MSVEICENFDIRNLTTFKTGGLIKRVCFPKNIDEFLNGIAVQTDGSSVALPGIATLNDAKIDMIVDKECDWFIDYNSYLID